MLCEFCLLDVECSQRVECGHTELNICEKCVLHQKAIGQCFYNIDGKCGPGQFTHIGPGAGIFWDHFCSGNCDYCRKRFKEEWSAIIYVCKDHECMIEHYERREAVARGLVKA